MKLVKVITDYSWRIGQKPKASQTFGPFVCEDYVQRAYWRVPLPTPKLNSRNLHLFNPRLPTIRRNPRDHPLDQL